MQQTSALSMNPSSSVVPHRNFTGINKAQALRMIFGSPSSVRGYNAAATSSSHNSSIGTPNLTRRIHQKESNSRVDVVSNKIRKHFSRESHMSKQSSRKRLGKAESHELIGPNDENKNTPNQGTLDDILASRTASEGGYDSDAHGLPTPRTIEEARAGSIRFSPGYLEKIMRGLEDPETVSSSIENPQQPETLLAKAEERHDDGISPQGGSPDSLKPTKSVNAGNDDARTPTAQTPSTPKKDTTTVLEFGNRESPTDLIRRFSATLSERPLQLPPEPDLRPLRLPSISESVSQQDWRLSFVAPTRLSSLRQTSTDVIARQLFDTPTKSASGPAYDLWTLPSAEEVEQQQKDEHSSGKPDIPEAVEQQTTGNPSPTKDMASRKASSAITTDASNNSIHLFDMRISQRLASHSVMPMTTPSRSPSGSKHKRNKSSFSSVSMYPYNVRHGRKQSDSGVDSPDKLHPGWGKRPKDDASSFYLSQMGSLPSSSRSSLRNIPISVGNEQLPPRNSMDVMSLQSLARTFGTNDDSVLPMPEGAWLRRNTLDTDRSFRSSTESFRNRELAGTEVRFAGKVRSVSMQEHKSSKFREEFAGGRVVASPGLSAEEISAVQLGRDGDRRGRGTSSVATRSTSDGWLSGGRRVGYGYDFVPDGDEEESAATAWERALRTHRDEQLQKQGSLHSRSGSKLSRESHLRGMDACKSGKRMKSSMLFLRGRRGVCPKGSVSMRRDSSSMLNVSGEAWSLGLGLEHGSRRGRSRSPGPQLIFSRKKGKGDAETPSRKSRSFPSWTRFPSHTRNERSGTAGPADKVVARDFSPGQDSLSTKNTNSGTPSSLRGRKKKSRSMTFGKNGKKLLKSWARLYRSHSSDLRRFRAGHRSSVSKGGTLEYPELEIVPGGMVPWVKREELGDYRGESRERSRRMSPRIENEEGESGIEQEAIPASAHVWSKLYEDCVVVPGAEGNGNNSAEEEEEASFVSCEEDHEHDEHQEKGKETRFVSLTGTMSSDLRGSTLDFKELLLLDKIQSREGLLRRADEAWGFDGGRDESHAREEEESAGKQQKVTEETRREGA